MRRIKHFSLPKVGNREDEYEDAYAWEESIKRIAVADGATDAFESRLWAEVLVHSFVHQHIFLKQHEFRCWIEASAQKWKDQIHWKTLSPSAEEKARRGAFATFLGVCFFESGKSSENWWAWAVGDACLFHIQNDILRIAFPIDRVEDFGTTPAMLSTRLDYSLRNYKNPCSKRERGECRQGDVLILATDAIAAWFLQEVAAGRQPWQGWQEWTQDTFKDRFDQLRITGEMRNDDVTLLFVWLEELPHLCE